VLRANTMAGHFYAVRAGIGIAALPYFSNDLDSLWMGVTDPVFKIENELW
jgi:hypothetical protein